MAELIAVSVVWAFSFGLVKRYLSGLDPAAVALIRLLLSLVVFLPFLRPRGLSPRSAARFFWLGMVQFGIMYVAYLASFRYLTASQVALFTVFTPLGVTLFADWRQGRFRGRGLAAALLAVAGAGIVLYASGGAPGGLRPALIGFLLVQVSNACFAFGQVYFRTLMAQHPGLREHRVFAISYLGAVCSVAIFCLVHAARGSRGATAIISLNLAQIIVLLYLGLLASGLAFFLWNRGALRVSSPTLAVLNNLKIPLAVTVSLLFFSEKPALLRLGSGALLLFLALGLSLSGPRERPLKGRESEIFESSS